MVENKNILVQFNSTTIWDIHIKYRYSTRPALNIGPQFDLLFNPEYWLNTSSFSNSKAGSSYLPKFDYYLFFFSLRSSSALSRTYFSKTCFRSLDVSNKYLGSNTILWSSFSHVENAEISFSVNRSRNWVMRVSRGTSCRSLAARTSASMAASFPRSMGPFLRISSVPPLAAAFCLFNSSWKISCGSEIKIWNWGLSYIRLLNHSKLERLSRNVTPKI